MVTTADGDVGDSLMDAPDLYTEINDDPVPDGLSEAPHPEELYKRWSHQKQEKARLLETIQKLAEENKRIMKERDEFEDECNTLRKRNNVYKKNAKMIFSVCRVELSKRERRIETLERRINSYGIVDGNPYSAAANSNEDDFSAQISLNLDTELRYTGILSELNHELMVLKSRASREDVNSNPNPVRDHPFDCRPFRGPKTPPTPSCSKSITARVRASSAERYDRKRDCRNSDLYSGSQSKYRRYDHPEDSKDPYHKMETRNIGDQLGDSNDYYESRDRRHVRRDNDDYINDQSQSDRNYGRYRDLGSKDAYMNRSDARIYSRDRDHMHEGERFHDRIDRGFSGERYHDKSRGYDNSQHRHDFKRTGDDNCRTYDHQSSDNQSLREDRDSRYLNGFKRNRASNEDKDEYPDRGDSMRDVMNNRDRYADRNYYEDNDGRSYAHRSQSGRRFHEDDVTDKGRGSVHENTDSYLSDERHRRRNSRESNSRDRQHTDIRSGHLYPSKRPEKHNMIHGIEKEIEKPVSHVHERDRKMYRKYDIESGSRGSSHSGVSPISHRHIKETRPSDRHIVPHSNGSVDLHNIPSSNSSDCSHDARIRDKTILQSSGNDSDSRKNGRTSCSPIVSPTSTGKGTVGGKLMPESHITNPVVAISAVTKETIEQETKVPSEQTTTDVATFSPSTVPVKAKSDVNADPAAWNKMKKVRDRKPILFTKVKESQKPEELDSIQTSLDVSFLRDLNNFTAKEIFQRLGKEGLPRDDFIRAEGVRIQKKEAEENEADNFVIGSEYKQNEGSEKPSDSTYTKRMREKLEKEERKASLPKISNTANAIPSPESPTGNEDVENKEENGGNASRTGEKSVNVSAPPPNQESLHPDTAGEEARSPMCYDDADKDQPKSHSDGHSDNLNNLKKLPEEEEEGKPNVQDENGVDICESAVGGGNVGEEISFVESYEHEEIVADDSIKSERADTENVKRDNNDDGPTPQQVANDSLTTDDAEERKSDVSGNSEESQREDSYDEENPSDHSPRKESEPLLDWEYEDDLHLEEVDTADVAADQELSDGECATGVQENRGDVEEGEMEEGEILDDSENESVSCTETSKDGKEKQKSKTKKGKKKEKDKSKKVRSQKTKKMKQGVDGHKVRVNKTKVSQKLTVSRGGKSQKVKASSRLRYSHDETAFKLTHRLTGNSKVARSSRTDSSVRQRHVDKYEPASQVERPSSLAPRRQRSEIKTALISRRGDGKVVNGRRKVLSKDISSGGYRGRSPSCRDNSLPTKSFRSRRHEAIDRHRARR